MSGWWVGRILRNGRVISWLWRRLSPDCNDSSQCYLRLSTSARRVKLFSAGTSIFRSFCTAPTGHVLDITARDWGFVRGSGNYFKLSQSPRPEPSLNSSLTKLCIHTSITVYISVDSIVWRRKCNEEDTDRAGWSSLTQCYKDHSFACLWNGRVGDCSALRIFSAFEWQSYAWCSKKHCLVRVDVPIKYLSGATKYLMGQHYRT